MSIIGTNKWPDDEFDYFLMELIFSGLDPFKDGKYLGPPVCIKCGNVHREDNEPCTEWSFDE